MKVSSGQSVGWGNLSIGDILAERRGQLLSLASDYGISNLRVVSPEAVGSQDSNSDILFLVDVPQKHNGRNTSAFVNAVESMLGCKVTVEINKKFY